VTGDSRPDQDFCDWRPDRHGGGPLFGARPTQSIGGARVGASDTFADDPSKDRRAAEDSNADRPS
jgi:hypothetical protein